MPAKSRLVSNLQMQNVIKNNDLRFKLIENRNFFKYINANRKVKSDAHVRFPEHLWMYSFPGIGYAELIQNQLFLIYARKQQAWFRFEEEIFYSQDIMEIVTALKGKDLQLLWTASQICIYTENCNHISAAFHRYTKTVPSVRSKFKRFEV